MENMIMNSWNGIQVRHKDDIGNLNYINEPNSNYPHLIGGFGGIRFPPIEVNYVFHITRTMLNLLQTKGLYDGSAHEDPHEYIRNFVDVCGPFFFKTIFQESVRLKLFQFCLVG